MTAVSDPAPDGPGAQDWSTAGDRPSDEPRPAQDESPQAANTRARRIGVGLLLVFAAIGLVIRLFAVTSWYPSCPSPKVFGEKPPEGCFQNYNWGDAFYFTTQAKLLAEGHGFINSPSWFLHNTKNPAIPEYLPGAGHPPLYTVVLAVLYKAGIDNPGDQRIVFPFVGAIGVLLVGAAAWQVAGRRGPVVGPIAAFIAATYPMMWINDFRYLSESIYIPIVALLVMAMYRFARQPSVASAALAGAMFGLAGLTRGEGFFILAFTVPFLLWRMKDRPWKERVALGTVVVGVMGALMAPWVLYNLSRFEEPVFVTSGTGMVLLHGSCDQAFYGDAVGYYSFTCADVLKSYDNRLLIYYEEHADVVAREFAIDYLKENFWRLPVVVLARIGRMWDLYAPFQNVSFNDQLEGRGYYPSLIGLWYYWLLIPLAVYGAVVLHRRGTPLSPLLGIAAAVTLTAALSFGVTRYRVPAEVSLVILAAIGVDAAVARWRGSRPAAVDTATQDPSSQSALSVECARVDEARSAPTG
ncbi:MAG: glycosyltransferase family 39 protein [Acidimicrobiales bacterium]|nr:glycosyltransferase family 39 protein [Acidimicrobiales bacterium]